jgi:adenylate cyclase
MKYKGTTKSLKEIGKELGVATILEGSVRRVGNRVRITGQLINTANDHHLWADKFDRDIEDIFAVQDEVSTAIANVLRIKLSDKEARLISSS